MYDATLLYTDTHLGTLIQYIRELDLGETIIVVTADHGDLFGEQGLLSHRLVVDDALTHVPLVVHGADGLEASADQLVQQIDLMQTLLGDAGADTGQSQGINLCEETREYVITERSSENFAAHAQQLISADRSFDLSQFPPTFLTALRTREFKYTKSDNQESLYRLPNEELDIKMTYPDVTRQLRMEQQSWRQSLDTDTESAGEMQLSDSDRTRLKQLGYL
jgi:uncharacterized sulfatase